MVRVEMVFNYCKHAKRNWAHHWTDADSGL